MVRKMDGRRGDGSYVKSEKGWMDCLGDQESQEEEDVVEGMKVIWKKCLVL